MTEANPATASSRQKFFYSFGMVGIGVYNGFNNAILSLYVQMFTGNPYLIGYLSNTKTLEGVVIQPLVGRWSDKTTGRWGRRRPFILFGALASVCFLLVTLFLGHLAGPLALPLVAGAIILFSIAWNVAQDPYQSLMVDITPRKQRPVFNAVLSVIGLVAQVGIVIYAAITIKVRTATCNPNAHPHLHGAVPDVIFYVTGGVLLVAFGLVFLLVREPKQATQVAQVQGRLSFRTYVRELRAFTQAFKLLVSVFFLWNGINPILSYITSFPQCTVKASSGQSLIIYATMIVCAGIFAYPFGKLGQRFGNKPFIVTGTVLLIVAALLGMVAPTYALLFPVAILAGAGFSATTVLTYPYLSELVPGSKIGLFTGLQTAFSALAGPLTILVTATLIVHFGYRSMFAMLTAMMVLDIVFLLWINDGKAHEQVRAVEEDERRLAAVTRPAVT